MATRTHEDAALVRAVLPRQTKRELFALLALRDEHFSGWLRTAAEAYIAQEWPGRPSTTTSLEEIRSISYKRHHHCQKGGADDSRSNDGLGCRF